MHSRRSFIKLLTLIPFIEPDKLLSAVLKKNKSFSFPSYNLIDDIIPIQPMSNPSGQIFYLDFVYGKGKDNLKLGERRHDMIHGWSTVILNEFNKLERVYDHELHLTESQRQINRLKEIQYQKTHKPGNFDKIIFPNIKNLQSYE